MLQAFLMRGGSHDGERIEHPGDGPPPQTVFVITFDDGERYARTGEQLQDDTGTPREVFEFDADGSLTVRARHQFAPLLED